MPLKVLVAYSASSTFVQTTLDYLNAIAAVPDFEVSYVHVTHDAVIDFDFSAYDIVFHNYCSRLCFEGYVSEHYRAALRGFGGLKILAVQDEYDETDRLKAAILDLGFDIVLTCVPQASLGYVYPAERFSNVTFVTVFTGYVPDDFAAKPVTIRALAERRVSVGYRGRDIGGRYGRLGFDKFEIGRRMAEICAARGVSHDIAMDEASRIYGMAWFDFVGDCRAMLGSESGSNVFDFDGSIAKTYAGMTTAAGAPPSYDEFLPVVAARDSEISMGQISPRVFECALMRTPMVLFEGWYSGAIEPDQHYIALKKDFSNADEVLARLADLGGLAAMADRAHAHLIASGRFSYRAFWERLVPIIESKRRAIGARPSLDETPMPLDQTNAYLAEKPTAQPLGLDHFRMRSLFRDLRTYESEVVRLEGIYGEVRERCHAFAEHLHKVGLDVWKGHETHADFPSISESAGLVEATVRNIAARQADYLRKATALQARLEASEGADRLAALEELVAHHKARAAECISDHELFNDIYLKAHGVLQERIANVPRRKPPRGGPAAGAAVAVPGASGPARPAGRDVVLWARRLAGRIPGVRPALRWWRR